MSDATPEDVLSAYRGGMSGREISKSFGMNARRVSKILREGGIDLQRGARPVELDEKLATYLYVVEGLSLQQVADRLGVTRRPVSNLLKRHGVEIESPERAAGTRQPKVEAEASTARMVDLYTNERMTLAKIAETFDMSPSSVRTRGTR